jgi:hypothetical protein
LIVSWIAVEYFPGLDDSLFSPSIKLNVFLGLFI